MSLSLRKRINPSEVFSRGKLYACVSDSQPLRHGPLVLPKHSLINICFRSGLKSNNYYFTGHQTHKKTTWLRLVILTKLIWPKIGYSMTGKNSHRQTWALELDWKVTPTNLNRRRWPKYKGSVCSAAHRFPSLCCRMYANPWEKS